MTTFQKQLSTLITSIVEKRTTIACLSCVMIDAKAKTIGMTDLDIFATISNAPITGKGKCLVDAYALQKIAAATKKTFSIAMTDEGIDVNSDGDTYKITSEHKTEDFPMLDAGEEKSRAKSVPLSMFKVGFSASTEQTRYYLNGVYLHNSEGGLTAVATDGHRLAVRKSALDVQGDFGVIVPNKSVKAIQRIFAGNVDIALTTKERLSIESEGISFYSRLIDGSFPDYQRVIPQSSDETLTLDMDSKEVGRICGKTGIVDGHAVHMFGGSTGWWLRLKGGKSTLEKKLSETKLPKTFEVGFNANYMSDIVDDMEGDTFHMHVNDPSAPLRIVANDNLYVLMPMRV